MFLIQPLHFLNFLDKSQLKVLVNELAMKQKECIREKTAIRLLTHFFNK